MVCGLFFLFCSLVILMTYGPDYSEAGSVFKLW